MSSTTATIITSNKSQDQHKYNLLTNTTNDAMRFELKQFLNEEVLEEMIANPTQEQMDKSLWFFFVVEKRDGRIKARVIAAGKTQTWFLEEETHSPTVRLESTMQSSLFDDIEQCEMVTMDIKRVFSKGEGIRRHVIDSENGG